MYNPFFNKYKYRLERVHEIIQYMILNYNDIVPADKYSKQGLEQARRIVNEFIEDDNTIKVIKDLKNRKIIR